jgi:hypothetical protein
MQRAFLWRAAGMASRWLASFGARNSALRARRSWNRWRDYDEDHPDSPGAQLLGAQRRQQARWCQPWARSGGHLELMRIARDTTGADGEVAVSIFVNPLQFEPGADSAISRRRARMRISAGRQASSPLSSVARGMYFTEHRDRRRELTGDAVRQIAARTFAASAVVTKLFPC